MTMTDRREWMGLVARSDPGMLAQLLGELPPHSLARAPETGAVMVRGRAGGTGAPFNIGEMTVTRCSVTLAGGAVGHAYVQGRDKPHATRAAILDALMQGDRAEAIRRDVLAPLARHAAQCAATRRAKAAATKVEFFTMVRGED
jgi:alpha-D-ribose 1-methylphosphonate 5-triphosphate synthase subunit PhnG